MGDSREKKVGCLWLLAVAVGRCWAQSLRFSVVPVFESGAGPKVELYLSYPGVPGIDAKTTGGNALAPDHWTSMSYPHYRRLGIGWRATAPISGMKWRRRRYPPPAGL